jgi:hypothetical protein
MRLSAHCIAFVLLVIACTPLQAAQIEPFEATYAWSWHGATVAVSTVRLEHQSGDTWSYSSASQPRGLGFLYPMRPKTQSILRISDSGVQPLSFRAEGGGADHDADVTFDWKDGRVRGTYEGTPVDMATTDDLQDDLSVQIAMIVALLRGKPPEMLPMIDKNNVRDYRYAREGEESIDTPLGRLDTVIYSSQHPGSPRITRFWCAPSQGYLPMRVEQKRIDSVEWSMQILTLKRG